MTPQLWGPEMMILLSKIQVLEELVPEELALEELVPEELALEELALEELALEELVLEELALEEQEREELEREEQEREEQEREEQEREELALYLQGAPKFQRKEKILAIRRLAMTLYCQYPFQCLQIVLIIVYPKKTAL